MCAFLGEDKTWTRGSWTPSLDRVHGPLSWTGSMDSLSWTRSMDIFFYFYKKVLHRVNGHSKTVLNSAEKRFDEMLSTNAHD